MTNEYTKVIEINGVKLEVDMRHAKQVHDNIKIGSRVKILDKEYSDTKVHHGVVVAFDAFQERPTITVLAIIMGYNPELRFYHIHKDSKQEMVPATDWLPDTDKATVVEKLDREILKKQFEIEEIEAKKKFFIEQYGNAFEKE